MQELKEALKFSISLGMAIEKATADKKINIMDLPYFFAPMMAAQDAFAGFDKIKEEIKLLDNDKVNELKIYIAEELDLESDKMEQIIEKGLNLMVDSFELMKLIKA